MKEEIDPPAGIMASMSTVRERIVGSALKLLETSGVGRFAPPQVARDAGILPSDLAYYFPKRTDLLKAVAARFVEAARRDVPRFLAENVDAAMEKQLQAFIASQVKNRKRTRAFIGLVMTSEDDDGLRAQLADNLKTLREVTALVLRRDADDPDIDIALATLVGLAIMHLVLEGKRPDAVTDALLDRVAKLRSELPDRPPPREAGSNDNASKASLRRSKRRGRAADRA
jgi:AcrR family transcriptional regulator